MRTSSIPRNSKLGFTIVELVIVIVVIGLLSAITVVSYDMVLTDSREKSMQADLQATYSKLNTYKSKNNEYPANLGSNAVTSDAGTTLTYNVASGGANFCLKATRADTTKLFSVIGDGRVVEGDCPVIPFASGSAIQTATTANCPSTRTLAVDARDNHTYWIQKLADGKCWMLTNLAYAGGGTNTYNDVMPTGDGTSGTLSGPDNAGSTTYTNAKYYIPDGANPTTAPTEPSTSTDGGATGKQYGYLYNFCAANRGQTGNGACTDSSSTAVDTTKSICPAGWRLPTGGSGGEFATLNTAINSGSASSDAGLIASPWLGQRGGNWFSGFDNQGSIGYYWSSTQGNSYSAYVLVFTSSYVDSSGDVYKDIGLSIRCLVS